jgi:hypothetical protein
VCGGCGKPVHWLAVVPTALGRRWHPGCLRCAHCSARIQVRICFANASVLAVLNLRPGNWTAHGVVSAPKFANLKLLTITSARAMFLHLI